MAQISVEKCEDPQKLHADIKAACRQLLEGWGALREEQVEVGGAGDNPPCPCVHCAGPPRSA